MSMTIHKQTASGWDKAIEDAHQHIVRLRRAIAVFEEMKATGKPWPSKNEGKTKQRKQEG